MNGNAMKRQLKKWLILSFVAFICVAQSGSAGAASSPTLGDILERTESYYKRLHAFTSYFRQWTTSSAASAMTTEASGKLYYQKPRQMRWEYELPEPQSFVANQRLAWLYEPNEKQITLFDATRFFASPLAQAFFDGMVELKKNFEVNLESKQSNKAVAVLKLVPKQEDPNIKELFLWIEMETYRITSIESRDALGNINRIMLDSQTAVDSLDSKLFQLDASPATTVLDAEGRVLEPAEIEKLKGKQ
jgi:outer membrane lipoprotein carrier protein